MKKEITIDGTRIFDKESLYTEINLKFMSDEDWKIGESLDALNDLFYGGFGRIKGGEQVRLIWLDFDRNQQVFGKDFTKKFYQEKLLAPEKFDKTYNSEALAALEKGTGKTYFEIILEIIADHPNIELVQA